MCDSPTILIVRGNFSKQPATTPGNSKIMTFPSVLFLRVLFLQREQEDVGSPIRLNVSSCMYKEGRTKPRQFEDGKGVLS